MEHRPTASIPDIVFLSPTGKNAKGHCNHLYLVWQILQLLQMAEKLKQPRKEAARPRPPVSNHRRWLSLFATCCRYLCCGFSRVPVGTCDMGYIRCSLEGVDMSFWTLSEDVGQPDSHITHVCGM